MLSDIGDEEIHGYTTQKFWILFKNDL